jgi:hypothetical protein
MASTNNIRASDEGFGEALSNWESRMAAKRAQWSGTLLRRVIFYLVFYHHIILYFVNYTHTTVFVNVNATRSNISVTKYTHDLYFSVQISHYAFVFFS